MKTLEEIREGYVSAAQRKAVWAARNDAKKEDKFNAQDMVAHDSKKVHKTRREDSDAVKAFLAKGGKIKKLPPAKAQGYHGKDDPGADVHGMMDKPDTKAVGTRKKVKSMEDDDTARMYKDNPEMMKKGGPGGYKGLNKAGKKAAKKAMGEAVKPTRAMHVFDNEKDARAKAKEIGGKYVKGTGKSMGKHAAIKEGDEKPPFDPPYRKAGEPRKDKYGNVVKNVPRHLARKAARDLLKKKQNNEGNLDELSPATKKSYIRKAASDIDNRSYAQGTVDATNKKYDGKNNMKIANRLKGIRRATKAEGNLDELSYDKMNKYYDAAKKSKDRATNSAVATIMRKGDHSQDLKTRAKRIKGMDLAKTRSIKKIRGDK